MRQSEGIAASVRRFALKVQFEQSGHDLGVRQLAGRFGPAVGGEHSDVEVGVGVAQPGRPLVIEVRQRKLLQLIAPGSSSPSVGGLSQFSRSSFSSFAATAMAAFCFAFGLGNGNVSKQLVGV